VYKFSAVSLARADPAAAVHLGRFQKRFRKKPKPKWMIKPMTKSLLMIRMSQVLAHFVS